MTKAVENRQFSPSDVSILGTFPIFQHYYLYNRWTRLIKQIGLQL